MDKQFVTTSASPSITLDISGDLRLKGQDSFDVVAKSDNPEDLTLEANQDEVTIRCAGNCSLRVPRASIVNLQAARGSAIIKAMDGELNIQSVSGDLELRNVGLTKIGLTSGNLAVKNVDGDLTVDTISGEASVRRVQGSFTVTNAIHGNLNLSDVGGSAVASVDGNILLRLDPTPGHRFDFKSRGNLFCRLPDDTSAEISVPKANQVMVSLPGVHATTPVQAPYAITLGEGDAQITLSADGNVVLDTHAPDWEVEDFDLDIDSEVNGIADMVSDQINQQVDSQMRMIEDQLNAQLSSLTMRLSASRLSADQAQRIEDRARAASERATARAQERIARAQQRMEHKMEAAQHRMEAAQRKMEMRAQAHEHASRHRPQHWGVSIPTPPTPPTPPGEPVSDDERLVILRMLEQKQISLDEAEALLSALEEKS
jgi:Toastrack DUF4097